MRLLRYLKRQRSLVADLAYEEDFARRSHHAAIDADRARQYVESESRALSNELRRACDMIDDLAGKLVLARRRDRLARRVLANKDGTIAWLRGLLRESRRAHQAQVADLDRELGQAQDVLDEVHAHLEAHLAGAIGSTTAIQRSLDAIDTYESSGR